MFLLLWGGVSDGGLLAMRNVTGLELDAMGCDVNERGIDLRIQV